jgi:hypothetical protein
MLLTSPIPKGEGPGLPSQHDLIFAQIVPCGLFANKDDNLSRLGRESRKEGAVAFTGRTEPSVDTYGYSLLDYEVERELISHCATPDPTVAHINFYSVGQWIMYLKYRGSFR